MLHLLHRGRLPVLIILLLERLLFCLLPIIMLQLLLRWNLPGFLWLLSTLLLRNFADLLMLLSLLLLTLICSTSI
jgi:hypothetical protein